MDYITTQKSDFITVETPSQEETYKFKIQFDFYLAQNMFIEARTKYNIWDLLGDVGGFNDGLFLVASLFMAPLS